MIQQAIASWTMTGFATVTHCAVLARAVGYGVVVTVNGEPVTDEQHLTCRSALGRAAELRANMLDEGFRDSAPGCVLIEQ